MRPGQTTLPAAAAAAAATTALLFLLSGLALTSGCNKALCASDVSKCLIQVKRRLSRPDSQISLTNPRRENILTREELTQKSDARFPLEIESFNWASKLFHMWLQLSLPSLLS